MLQTMGKRITACRKKLGMTQDQLAERLGVTPQAISKWENDQSCPDIAMLPRLADLFGITVDELIGHTSAGPVYDGEVIDQTPDENQVSAGNRWKISWDSGRRNAVCFAIFVLLTGCLVLLSAIFKPEVGFWAVLWPTAVLMLGVSQLAGRFSFFSLGCTLFGIYFLLENFGVSKLDLGFRLIFPIVLVLLGLSLLADALRKKKKGPSVHVERGSGKNHSGTCSVEDGTFACVTSFGSDTHCIRLPRLCHGSAECSFGELTVDLSGVRAAADDCRIRAKCSFGELALLVPVRYQILPATSTAFAAVNITGQPDEDALPIHLDASVSFGEISVKYI